MYHIIISLAGDIFFLTYHCVGTSCNSGWISHDLYIYELLFIIVYLYVNNATVVKNNNTTKYDFDGTSMKN